MGTSKSGRYLNTRGSARAVSNYALVHSNEGTFSHRLVYQNGKHQKKLILASGGHGQAGIKLLDKYHIKYNIVKTYSNDVRVGNVPDHQVKRKRTGTHQAWFPKSWSEKDIKHAGEHVAGLKHNRHQPDGSTLYGTWKGVRVGVKLTHGRISTVFPTYEQPKGAK